MNTVNSGHTLFFRASASCSKIRMIKVYSMQWKFSGQTLSLGQAQVAQKSSMIKKCIQYSGKFHGKLCFSVQCEKFFNAVYSASKGNYRKVFLSGRTQHARNFTPLS